MLYRLDTPELADTLAGRSSTDDRISDLSSRLQSVQERLDDLPAAYAAGEIDRPDWALARKPLEEQREHLQRQLGRLTHTSALDGLIGNGQALGPTWSDLTLSRQHAIVKAIIDHIDIAPGTPGVTALDPARVSVIWRH